MEYIQPDNHERRKTDVPVEYERRNAERIAVLEVRVDNVDANLASTNANVALQREAMEKIFAKFDNHISYELSNSISMNSTLVKVSTVVDSLTHEIKRTNDTLTDFNSKLDVTHNKVIEWDSAARTIIKVAIVLTALVSAGWTLFEYYETHTPIIQQVSK